MLDRIKEISMHLVSNPKGFCGKECFGMRGPLLIKYRGLMDKVHRVWLGFDPGIQIRFKF